MMRPIAALIAGHQVGRDTVRRMHARQTSEVVPGPVTVVGIGADGWAGLTQAARDALHAAAVIVGSPRQLAMLPELGARREPLPSPLLDHLDDLIRDNSSLCVLASGNPMLHGIGATLASRLGTAGLRVLPAVSSIALACARLGWAQQDVTVVSLLSQPPEAALPAMQPGAQVLLLCRDGQTPARAARVLTGAGWGNSDLTVLEQLGGPAERIVGPDPASRPAWPGFDDLSIVAVAARPAAATVATARTRCRTTVWGRSTRRGVGLTDRKSVV